MELPKEEWKYIDSMFNEAIIGFDVDGYEVVTLPLLSHVGSEKGVELSLQFFTLNGAYAGLEMWEVAKQHGTKA